MFFRAWSCQIADCCPIFLNQLIFAQFFYAQRVQGSSTIVPSLLVYDSSVFEIMPCTISKENQSLCAVCTTI